MDVLFPYALWTLVSLIVIGSGRSSTYADASAWCASYRRDAQRRSDLMPVMRAEE